MPPRWRPNGWRASPARSGRGSRGDWRRSGARPQASRTARTTPGPAHAERIKADRPSVQVTATRAGTAGRGRIDKANARRGRRSGCFRTGVLATAMSGPPWLIDENWEQMVTLLPVPAQPLAAPANDQRGGVAVRSVAAAHGRGETIQEGRQRDRRGMEDVVGRRTQVPAPQFARATAGRGRRAAVSRRPTYQRRPTPGGRRLICLHTY